MLLYGIGDFRPELTRLKREQLFARGLRRVRVSSCILALLIRVLLLHSCRQHLFHHLYKKQNDIDLSETYWYVRDGCCSSVIDGRETKGRFYIGVIKHVLRSKELNSSRDNYFT